MIRINPIGYCHFPVVGVQFVPAIGDVVKTLPLDSFHSHGQIVVRSFENKSSASDGILDPCLMAGKPVRAHVVGGARRMLKSPSGKFSGRIFSPWALDARSFLVPARSSGYAHDLEMVIDRMNFNDD